MTSDGAVVLHCYVVAVTESLGKTALTSPTIFNAGTFLQRPDRLHLQQGVDNVACVLSGNGGGLFLPSY